MHRLLTSALQHFHLQNKTQNGSRAADGRGSGSASPRGSVSWDRNGTFLQFFSYHWNIEMFGFFFSFFFFLTTAFLNVTVFQRPSGSQPGRSWEGEAASFTEVFFPRQGAASRAPLR